MWQSTSRVKVKSNSKVSEEKIVFFIEGKRLNFIVGGERGC
jgi:hypothetical protein